MTLGALGNRPSRSAEGCQTEMPWITQSPTSPIPGALVVIDNGSLDTNPWLPYA